MWKRDDKTGGKGWSGPLGGMEKTHTLNRLSRMNIVHDNSNFIKSETGIRSVIFIYTPFLNE